MPSFSLRIWITGYLYHIKFLWSFLHLDSFMISVIIINIFVSFSVQWFGFVSPQHATWLLSKRLGIIFKMIVLLSVSKKNFPPDSIYLFKNSHKNWTASFLLTASLIHVCEIQSLDRSNGLWKMSIDSLGGVATLVWCSFQNTFYFR